MKSEIIYVELKSGFSHNGPAWIGPGAFSRTGQTVYFNGKIFKKCQGTAGNHFDLETGDEYWISGIKKKGADRHHAGSGTIEIDKSIIDQYLELRGLMSLPKTRYTIVNLNNEPARQLSRDLENQNTSEPFDESLKFKNISDLNAKELNILIDYYQNLDLSSIHKKARTEYIDKINELIKRKQNVAV